MNGGKKRTVGLMWELANCGKNVGGSENKKIREIANCGKKESWEGWEVGIESGNYWEMGISWKWE